MQSDSEFSAREGVLESSGLPPEEWSALPPLLGGNPANHQLNACIGRQYDDISAEDGYIRGYRQAAELIAIPLEQRKDWMDTLVYPFVLLWRHHFELLLKQMIRESHKQTANSEPPARGHRLAQLWSALRLRIEPRYSSHAQVLDKCEELFKAFDEIDKTSQVFRYVHDTKGRRHLANDGLLNIADFNLVAASLTEFLQGVHLQIQNSQR